MRIGTYDQLTRHILYEGLTEKKRLVLENVKIVPFEEVKQLHTRVRGLTYSLYATHTFIGTILMEMKVNITRDVKTLAVDSTGNIYINPEFCAKELADDSHLKFVLAHEALHIALLTHFRERGRSHKLWNIATDAVINYVLVVDGLNPPVGTGIIPTKDGKLVVKDPDTGKVLIDMNVADKSAEVVYMELAEKMGDDGEGGTNPPPPPPPPPPGGGEWVPRKGDIIRNEETGEFGQILSVGPDGVTLNTRMISEDEAKRLAKTAKPLYM